LYHQYKDLKLKQLLIIRHAKSSWDNFSQNDFDRPLNDRGHRDAPDMAKRLFEKKIAIDAFISSPAKRAFTTAQYFAGQYGTAEDNIIQIPGLYHAPAETFYDIISKTNDTFNTIAVFSHNPGITHFVNGLTSTEIDNMPTSGIFAVKAEISRWQDFKKCNKIFWFFSYPKLKA